MAPDKRSGSVEFFSERMGLMPTAAPQICKWQELIGEM